MNPTTQPEGPVTSDSLQPLREVGSMDKTQFWDMDEVICGKGRHRRRKRCVGPAEAGG